MRWYWLVGIAVTALVVPLTQDVTQGAGFAQGSDGVCQPGPETLCLHAGRYEVKAKWWTDDEKGGSARVVPKMTADSGLFRFFDAENWEILIKVLDGCVVNSHHWVYGASTTDLGYEIRVKDTATGDVKEYRNEPGQPAPAITDAEAFPRACESGAPAAAVWPRPGPRGVSGVELVPLPATPASEAGCASTGRSLCLADGRFEVTVDWSTGGGAEGAANTVPCGTDNSGLFYFFDPDNWEMLIKVLDGCAINEHYWVYSAAATDLGLAIKVTDTESGATWTYTKERGPPAPAITESEAFPCSPWRPVLVSPGSIAAEWPFLKIPKADIGLESHLLPLAADFDGDGDDDVLLAGGRFLSDELHSGVILINNGDFTFEVAAGDRPRGKHPREVLMADFNDDGSNDFFIADHGYDAPPYPGWRNQLLLWNPNGYLDASDRLPSDPTGFTHSAAAGDIDGDADLDILVGNNGPGPPPYFLMNDGEANFAADRGRLPDSMDVGSARRSWAVELADLDGDGYLDLLTGANGDFTDEGEKSFVFWGSAAGEYRDEDATVLPTSGFYVAFGRAIVVSTLVHDFNGDGRPDVLFGGYDESFSKRGVQLLVNSGGRIFVDETLRRLGESAWSAAEGWNAQYGLVDFNADGALDIAPEIGFSEEPNNVLAWLNDGTGHYAVLRSTDFDNIDDSWPFISGVSVRAGGRFRYLHFFDWDAHLFANGGVVVEGAVIRRRF